jgi:hypothetical protein
MSIKLAITLRKSSIYGFLSFTGFYISSAPPYIFSDPTYTATTISFQLHCL